METEKERPSDEEDKIELPPGFSVKEDKAVGYSFYDEKGQIVAQHPKDNNAIRQMVCDKYRRRNRPLKVMASSRGDIAAFKVVEGEKEGLVICAEVPKAPGEYWYSPINYPQWLDPKEFSNRLQDYLNECKKKREAGEE